jgi:hypothetical protein
MSGAGFKDTHLAEDKAKAIEQQKAVEFNVEAIRVALSDTAAPCKSISA